MLYPKSKISEHLADLGINPNDNIMIHGNAGIASQYIYNKGEEPIIGFFKELIGYICDGTIIVPTFTYSATKSEVFDVDRTSSNVGLFSEKFRLIDGAKRSHHPIFSVSAIGKNTSYFIDARIDDCFGKNTFFDKLYNNNVKIVMMGCDFERATFLHYVEQKLDVSYRYFKQFNARVHYKGKTKNFIISYFVRNTQLSTNFNFELLESEALRKRKISIGPFGRFKARSILTKNLFEIASELIESDEYALIEEKKLL